MLTAVAPVQHFATSKHINEAFIWGFSSPQLVHERHGHNSMGRPARLPTAACTMARLMGMPFLVASTKGSKELLGS